MAEGDQFGPTPITAGQAEHSLNTVDVMKNHNAFSIAKEPVFLGAAGVIGTTAGVGSRLVLDSILYDEYSIQPLLHRSDILNPDRFHAPTATRTLDEMPLLKRYFEGSCATKTARQASATYLESKATMAETDALRRAALKEVEGVRNHFGSVTTESIFGTFNKNNVTLGQNILRMDQTALANAESAFALTRGEMGMIRSAQNALQAEAAVAGTAAKASQTYHQALKMLNEPATAGVTRNFGEALGYGAVGFGASYALDRAAVSMADSYYGPNSKLGRVMESNAVGLGLSTFGAILGPDLRSKIVLGVGGWAVGKLYNWATDT